MSPIARELGNGYCVSSGTLKVTDLLPSFIEELARWKPHSHVAIEYGEELAICERQGIIEACTDAEYEALSEALEAVTRDLEVCMPDGYYFGTTEGDGACFGVWCTDEAD